MVFESRDAVIEAPNWSPDGAWLVYNAAGALYRVAADCGAHPERIETGRLADHNNDHLISRDGGTIYSSSEGDGHLYSIPFGGGERRRISPEKPGPFGYFLQGISPDGRTLYYTGGERRGGRRFVSNLFALVGGAGIRLSDFDDDSIGCEVSADGDWLYFNSDRDAARGHSQLYRMRADGSGIQRLTGDERVNWFPKPSPRGDAVVFLSFPPGTRGHEANVPVVLRAMGPDGSNQRDVVALFGGQGTMNVSSWSLDGTHFAYVDYPLGPDSVARTK